MVKLPSPPSNQPTLDAVRKAMISNAASEPVRDYLGASAMGHECDRHLWYMANGYTQSERHINAIAAAQDGYAVEPILIERLRLVSGVEVVSHQPDGSQYEFSKFGGKFKGHPDGFIKGILEAPKTWHVLEFKSKEEKYFNELDSLVKTNPKTALYRWNVDYYVQAQIYMRMFDLDRHYLVCVTPGARKMTSCRTDLNREQADYYIARAKRIIETVEIPERRWKEKTFFKCKFCNYKDHCWGE